MTDTASVKTALRSTARSARRGMDDDERRSASRAAAARLLALPELRGAETVLLYAPLQEEADPATATLPLLRQRGIRTLLPRVRGDELELVAVTELTGLALGYRGIREPAGPPIDPEMVDLAVVPGVAFDVLGGRLGHGGGHYDRLLQLLSDECVRVGFCFSCQVVPFVPCEPHDEPVDLVVTERATYRTRAREPLADA
ncbi:MAG: 5-formyltetrahydrofolate cyclo-ligase [Actinobacteria bacterium]|nr:5-formyltetrahydrofolate cyclo-ligase [Actinomycetota bacterium]